MPDATTQTKVIECVFKPARENPDEAEKFVRTIFKHKPNNVDLVAAELAPLYGLGPESNFDPLARSRAQAVFTSPEITDALREFLHSYTRDQWGLPVAKFNPTLDLVHQYRRDERWTELHHQFPHSAAAEQHYARFLIRMLDKLDNPFGKGTHMLQWLRNGVYSGNEDDVCWVLFHALMCFQLKRMELNKYHAPMRKVAEKEFHHFFKCIGEMFESISKLISGRKGLSEVGPSQF